MTRMQDRIRAQWILDGHTPKRVGRDKYYKWASQPFDVTRRVANDSIGDVGISTVFLSIDHSYSLDDDYETSPPILFETMVFRGDHDGEMWRYSTWDEAVAGHEAVVAAVRGKGKWPE